MIYSRGWLEIGKGIVTGVPTAVGIGVRVRLAVAVGDFFALGVGVRVEVSVELGLGVAVGAGERVEPPAPTGTMIELLQTDPAFFTQKDAEVAGPW